MSVRRTLALLLTLTSLLLFDRWRAAPGGARWFAFLAALLGAALAKFTLLVPFVPVLVAALWRHRPTGREIVAGASFVWSVERTR